MAYKLQNYLRTYRKRFCLSQDELAFLLGCRNGTKVSHYERLARHPNLQNAFAYEVIFGTPPRELFAGVYQKVERTTIKRARMLAQKLAKEGPNPVTSRKLEILRAVASVPGSEPVKDQ